MADITLTPAQVRPLEGAIMRRYTAGEALNVGDAVYMDSDGTLKAADADAEASAQARGIVVSVGVAGKTAAASGDAVAVVTHGAVALGSSALTIGSPVFISPTAGKLDQTAPAAAGDFPFAIGWAESDFVLYVQPQIAVPTVNS